MRRLRDGSKSPLAIAGILAMPLFFAALMAASLAVEKPSVVHTVRQGKAVATYGDPAGLTEVKIWLLAAAPCIALVLIGLCSVLLGRLGVALTAVAAIALSLALVLPLGGWARRHSDRFPVGVDLVPPSAGSQDIYLQGEWEANAKRTATQLGVATIAIAGIALAAVAFLETRRRRGAPTTQPA